MEIKLTRIDKEKQLGHLSLSRGDITKFLRESLGKYRDEKKSIEESIDYAFSKREQAGGFILVGRDNNALAGAVVINFPGLGSYVPPNFLVYIAVSEKYRGKGIGTRLMDMAKKETEGGISLHVEKDNPAKRLYERAGFTNKYTEMRLEK